MSPLCDEQGFTQLADFCPTCQNCGAAITSYSALNSGAQWICVFCDTDNETIDRYGHSFLDWSQFPELQTAAAVQWDEGPADHLVADSQDTLVFVLDLTMSQSDLQGVTNSLAEALKVLALGGANPKVSVIGFDNTVQLFHLDSSSLSSSLCVPAIRSLNGTEQEMLQEPAIRSRLIVPLQQALQGGSGGLISALETIGQSALYMSNSGQASRERGLAGALDVAAFLTNPLSFDPDAPAAYADHATPEAKLNRSKIKKNYFKQKI